MRRQELRSRLPHPCLEAEAVAQVGPERYGHEGGFEQPDYSTPPGYGDSSHLARARGLMGDILLWWYRTVSDLSYVKGWKISPSHYRNQGLARDQVDK